MKKAYYIMIGGFLGAGKTTAIGRLARKLTGEGRTVGLITNDQGRGLVDTATLRSQGFHVEEVPGACFCCRFESLKAASDRLNREARPDIFIAEPVGSCTDLVATVSYPLRRIYGDDYRVAPLSVLVDPIRALRILQIEPGRKFSRNVAYIYKKQLEDADLIVINKRDIIDAERLERLRDGLAREYPRAEILDVSALGGEGLDAWFERLLGTEAVDGEAVEIDYGVYADAEARLGWLNGTLEFSAAGSLDGNALVKDLAARIHEQLAGSRTEIAHLKLTLSPNEAADGVPGEVAVVNLTATDREPEAAHELSAPVESGRILVNLRAEADPDSLREVMETEIRNLQHREDLSVTLQHLECFKPGKPEPTYRMAPRR